MQFFVLWQKFFTLRVVKRCVDLLCKTYYIDRCQTALAYFSERTQLCIGMHMVDCFACFTMDYFQIFACLQTRLYFSLSTCGDCKNVLFGQTKHFNSTLLFIKTLKIEFIYIKNNVMRISYIALQYIALKQGIRYPYIQKANFVLLHWWYRIRSFWSDLLRSKQI